MAVGYMAGSFGDALFGALVSSVFGGDWLCPMCWGRERLLDMGSWISDVYIPTGPGSGTAVCRRCATTKAGEIRRVKDLYRGSGRGSPDCAHEWQAPYPGRFYCARCGAG